MNVELLHMNNWSVRWTGGRRSIWMVLIEYIQSFSVICWLSSFTWIIFCLEILNNWNLIRNSFEPKLITEIKSCGFCLVRGEWQVVLFPNASSSSVRSNSNSAQWQCLHREHMPLLLVLWFELQLLRVNCFSQGKSTKKLDLIAPFALAFIATTTEQSSLPFTSLEFLFQTLKLN